MIIQDKELCYVAVPEGAQLKFRNVSLGIWDKEGNWLDTVVLPPGSWEPVGMMPGMSEDKAAELVRKVTVSEGFFERRGS